MLLDNKYVEAYWANAGARGAGIVAKDRFTGLWDVFTRDGVWIEGSFTSKTAATNYATTY